MTTPTIFDKAVSAHAQWKGRLRQAIETGESEWTVGDVRVDDRCEFGEWLKSLPMSERTSDSYSHLHELHSEFHRAAAEVLALALSGKKEEAENAMSMGSPFAKTSVELVLTLSKWGKADAERD